MRCEKSMRRVVIVGAGFGGLRAARTLAGKNLDVLLVDRNNYHLFQPLLYQVATAGLEPENIAYPIRAAIRRWHNTRVMLAEMHGLDLVRRQVMLDSGTIEYDYLILATGSVPNYYGLKTVERRSFSLNGLGGAVALRNHILKQFEHAAQEPDPAARAALMSFVVVGGGPTGVELAGSLTELVKHSMAKDYPGLPVKNSRIVLIEALDEVLPSFAPLLKRYTHRRLNRLGVEIMLGTSVIGAEMDRVLLKDGSGIPSHTLIWAAGVQASPPAGALSVSKGRSGRIMVTPGLTIDGHPEVFIIGDMAYREQDGAALPMLASVAMQQGEYAAKSILQRERGRPVVHFRYRDKGTMAIVGRFAAVANAFGINLVGPPAWVAWLVLHLYYLMGFRNRLMTLHNWLYDYLLFDPKVRLIMQYPASHDEPPSIGL